jgi:hypothetical protein
MKKLYLKIFIKIVILVLLTYGFIQFSKNINEEGGAVLPSIAFTQVIREINPFDLDWDGIPNTWEEQYSLNPNDDTDAYLDGDNDGLTNLNEYINNTDPTNSDTDGGSLIDGSEVTQGKNPLDPTDDITIVPEEEPGNGNNDNNKDNDSKDKKPTAKEPKQIIPIEDIDNDRLTNEEETTIYFTNPTLGDSDYDGLSDYDEVLIYFTDPNNFDTDEGGVSDGDEITNRTNPKNAGDDIKYYLNIYMLNDKDNQLQNPNTHKQVCVSNEPLTLYFNTEVNITNTKVLLNNNETTLYTKEQTLELKCPTSGINKLDISFAIKNKTYHITRQLESLHKGKVEMHYNGVFVNYYKYIPKYKPTLLKNKEIYIEKVLENSTQKYTSNIYDIKGTIKTNENGEYLLITEPGKYRYYTNEHAPKYFNVTASTPVVYNKTLILEKNGDGLFGYLIGGHITVTLTVLGSVLLDIKSIGIKKTKKRK